MTFTQSNGCTTGIDLILKKNMAAVYMKTEIKVYDITCVITEFDL